MTFFDKNVINLRNIKILISSQFKKKDCSNTGIETYKNSNLSILNMLGWLAVWYPRSFAYILRCVIWKMKFCTLARLKFTRRPSWHAKLNFTQLRDILIRDASSQLSCLLIYREVIRVFVENPSNSRINLRINAAPAQHLAISINIYAYDKHN